MMTIARSNLKGSDEQFDANMARMREIGKKKTSELSDDEWKEFKRLTDDCFEIMIANARELDK